MMTAVVPPFTASSAAGDPTTPCRIGFASRPAPLRIALIVESRSRACRTATLMYRGTSPAGRGEAGGAINPNGDATRGPAAATSEAGSTASFGFSVAVALLDDDVSSGPA